MKLAPWQRNAALTVFVAIFFLGVWLGGAAGKTLTGLGLVFAIAAGGGGEKKGAIIGLFGPFARSILSTRSMKSMKSMHPFLNP